MKPQPTLFITFILLFLISVDSVLGQRARITVEPISPRKLRETGWTSNTTTGLHVVPKGTVVYLSARELAGAAVTSVVWEMTARPIGSVATLDSTTSLWTTFRTDTVGQYRIRATITTASGSADTSIIITSAKFSGVGSVGGVTPIIGQGQCAACHAGTFPSLEDKVTPWMSSKHATMFKRGIDGQVAPYYSGSCIKCHTTGYDTQPTATNNGFDDRMTAAGWQFPTALQPGNFDTLVARHPQLAQVATIGCESCHGPGNQHFGIASKIAVDVSAGVCATCHDEPWRYPIVKQWENSPHSKPVYSGSFRQLPTNVNYMTNNFDNCVRCHDGVGYINFTKNRGTATDSLFAYNLTGFTCASCHEPHNSPHPYQLRKISADTLRNGFVIPANVGSGGTCMNCHKTRRVGETYPLTANLSALWSPHYGAQTDMYFGQNAHTYGQNIPSSVAHRLVNNSCVGCHMSATPDTGQAGRDLIGGHTWRMSAQVGGQTVHNVSGCISCHGPITSFSDIIAAVDYDGDGTIEPFTYEVKGLKRMLAEALPPYGIDSVAWQLIRLDPDSVRLKKAFYNYKFVSYDGSNGVHNPKYTIGLLQRSITTLTGVEFDNDIVPAVYALEQNYPNPFNPSTMISFSIPEMTVVKLGVYDIIGRLVTTLMDEEVTPGNYKITWSGTDMRGNQVASGVYLYRLETSTFTQTKKMLMVK